MTDVAIVAIQDQIESLSREGKAIVINDNASYSFAGEFLKRVKQAQKQVDDTRKGMTRPLDDSKKKIMDLFRPVENKIAEVEASLKSSLIQYQRVVDERIRKEQEERRIKDEAELAEKMKDAEFFGEKDIEIEPSKAEDAPVMAPVVSGVSTKTVWSFEITSEALLTREFLSPDLKKIRAAVDFGMRDVPGLRIFQQQVISARG